MRNNIFRGLAIALLITCIGFSQGFGQNNTESGPVSLIFKTIAKVFVYTIDLEKLKRENIDRISSINDEGFRQRYLDFYEHIYDYKFMVDKYGLSSQLDKKGAIERINSLDKLKLYEIIDRLPDSIIIREVKKYLDQHKLLPQKKSEFIQKTKQMLQHLNSKYLKGS